MAAAAVWGARSSVCLATISIDQISSSDWAISNGDLNITFNPGGDNITSLAIGSSGSLLDPNKAEIYSETDGTPFGKGTQTSGYQETSNYIDFWTSTASTGTTTNPITYSFHYVLFNNDPDVICYEVVNHSATDPATSITQGQFLARVNQTAFFNSVQSNVSPNNPGLQTAYIPNSYTFPTATGTVVQDSTNDLTGSGIPGDWGTNFYTKYDYSSYDQFLQANTEYGPNYSVSAIYTSMDTLNGGPTKQGLQFTNNIAMVEFLSSHYGDANYAYVPTQGENTSKVFGPYAFRFVDTDGETGAQLEQDAINSMPQLQADYNTDSELISTGYLTSQSRGSVDISAACSAGWSSNTTNNTVVLSDPDNDFQNSAQGYQYWAQLSSSGAATISNVAPGTYELTLYQLGQWGETVVQGVKVTGGQVDIPRNLTFTPQNFGGTLAPIWTIGTPDRSDHEFLNGGNVSVSFVNHNAVGTPITTNGVTPGGDLRQYWGAYNYWYEEQQLGTPGYVSYYATAVGSTPATNNPLDWIANQFGEYNPGIYDPANNTSNGYSAGYGPDGGAPAYVTAAGGPKNYKGSAWQVNFTTTSQQSAEGKYIDLSVGLAANEGNLTISLNGNPLTWTYGANNTDAMIRSGDSGVYDFLVYQWPVSDLKSAGSLDQMTFSVSTNEGDEYDALRMEIDNTGANPAVTGWDDYYFITQGAAQISTNFSAGLSATNSYAPQTSTWAAPGAGGWEASNNWLNSSIPGLPGTAADFTSAIVTPSNVNLDAAWTVGTLYFNNTNSYTLAAGAGGSLILNNGTNSADIEDAGGTHYITAPVALQSNLLISVDKPGDGLTISGNISGNGGISTSGAGTVTLTGSNSYSGPTAAVSGLLVIGTAAALPASTGLTIGSATTVATVQLALNSGQSVVTSLAVNPGSRLDIGNNSIAVNYGSPSAESAVVAAIVSALAQGYSGGTWTGTGITSSTAAASVGGKPLLAVGYADGNVDVGTPAAPNQVLIKMTLAGDANLDGTVDFNDLDIVGRYYNTTGNDWSQGNFTYDPNGAVNFNDLDIIGQNINQTINGGDLELAETILPLGDAASLQVQNTAVPEPGGLVLAAAGAAGLLVRRRRRPTRSSFFLSPARL
jgi:autotransporter-associated beta strand protein